MKNLFNRGLYFCTVSSKDAVVYFVPRFRSVMLSQFSEMLFTFLQSFCTRFPQKVNICTITWLRNEKFLVFTFYFKDFNWELVFVTLDYYPCQRKWSFNQTNLKKVEFRCLPKLVLLLNKRFFVILGILNQQHIKLSWAREETTWEHLHDGSRRSSKSI